ncbi:MAG: hypothetical protein RSE93_07180, partial [Oscillospiraceae bacterium]
MTKQKKMIIILISCAAVLAIGLTALFIYIGKEKPQETAQLSSDTSVIVSDISVPQVSNIEISSQETSSEETSSIVVPPITGTITSSKEEVSSATVSSKAEVVPVVDVTS